MATAHTPGPWSIGRRGRVKTITNPQGGCNVVVSESSIGNPANAALIAAAPDLLWACERVLRAIEWADTADRMESHEQAELLRAVVCKATGQN